MHVHADRDRHSVETLQLKSTTMSLVEARNVTRLKELHLPVVFA